jgi:hypothetical protein
LLPFFWGKLYDTNYFMVITKERKNVCLEA